MARSVVLQFTAGANGHARIRYIGVYANSDTVTAGKWVMVSVLVVGLVYGI